MIELDNLLLAEKNRLNEERQALEAGITAAQKRLKEIHGRLRHVDGLLGVSESSEAVATGASKPAGRTMTDLAAEILDERQGDPMYYKDLAQEVQSRGGDLSGVNAANILVARLVSDDRFVRPLQKGYYALKRDYPDAKNVGARRRRRAS